ncbi:hypothetical protein K474DRAFT_1667785 [Panus rudis PR-1116 ss-1]|nr:hypothetical protein K474DRAFT_1667785 [Panus rudis PR-1116 ss-1]
MGKEVPLPPELLHLIKEEIPLTDLRSHVCFFKASPVFAALYGDVTRQERFWERACLSVGLGAPDGDADEEYWKAVAFECIEKDGWCKHSQCGVNRLQWNAEQMQALNLPDFTWTALRESIQSVVRLEDCPDNFAISPLFEYVSFHYTSTCGATPKQDVLLDYRNGNVEDEENPANLLCNHPIASRSFAVFPPVDHVWVLDIGYESKEIQNVDGVTVSNVMDGIWKRMDRDITAEGFADKPRECDLQEAIGELFKVDPSAALKRVKSEREFFYYFRLNGFSFEEWWTWGDMVSKGGPWLLTNHRLARISRPKGTDPRKCETIAAPGG